MPFFLALPIVLAVGEIIKVAAIVGGTVVAVNATGEIIERVAENIKDSGSTRIICEVPTTEKKTLYDWWNNGISYYERGVLHELGVKDKESTYTLEELKAKIVNYMSLMYARAPGEPTAKEGFKPKKNWDKRLVKNPNGGGYGYPDEDGNVWVPTGEGGHGGPHWDKQNPKTGKHTNVFPKKERENK